MIGLVLRGRGLEGSEGTKNIFREEKGEYEGTRGKVFGQNGSDRDNSFT